MSKQVWVEVGHFGIIKRIFRSEKAAHKVNFMVGLMDRAEAVAELRHQLFVRSGGECELCGSPVTERSGQMHEMKHRGKGGEISLENSVFICPKSHKFQHRARAPHWGG